MLTEIHVKQCIFLCNPCRNKKFTDANGLLTNVNPSRGNVCELGSSRFGLVGAHPLAEPGFWF